MLCPVMSTYFHLIALLLAKYNKCIMLNLVFWMVLESILILQITLSHGKVQQVF